MTDEFEEGADLEILTEAVRKSIIGMLDKKIEAQACALVRERGLL